LLAIQLVGSQAGTTLLKRKEAPAELWGSSAGGYASGRDRYGAIPDCDQAGGNGDGSDLSGLCADELASQKALELGFPHHVKSLWWSLGLAPTATTQVALMGANQTAMAAANATATAKGVSVNATQVTGATSLPSHLQINSLRRSRQRARQAPR
jgi:hypothetical protein